MRRTQDPYAHIALGGFFVLLAVLALHYAGVPLPWPAPAEHVYEVLDFAAASCCLWRAAAYRPERAAWLAIGLGLLSFMRRHTIIGERILAAAPALADVAPLVRSSHERYDGDGYPDRLTGDRIPIGARVIAVCDAWDAMVSDRPCRRGMTPELALEELDRCAGSQFDPDVVMAFRAALRQLDPAALRAA